MINKTSFSKMPSKRGFTLFLSFFLVAIFAITFQACRKEAFTEQLSSSSALKNPITSDAAKAWFQNQFGETKLISPNSISSSSDTLDGYYFDASYEITPLWSESKITAYLRTNPILLVPVKPIPFLDAKGQHYTLIFFRDSLNQLDARLQVYEATPEYAKNNARFSVDNFTGFFYQIHLTGKVDKVYGIEQGKFTHRIQLKPKEKTRIAKIQTRGFCDGCFYDDPTAGIGTKIRCWLCDKFAISNGDGSGIDPITSTDPSGLSGYGQTPTIDIGYGENTSVGSTGGGNPLGSGGNGLGTEFDDSIFNDPSNQQKIKEDHVLLTLNPTGTERQFLADNRALFDQFYSFLTQQGDYSEKISTAKQHLKLLMENTAYLSANQQANFPAIGTVAWAKTLSFDFDNINEPPNSAEIQLVLQRPYDAMLIYFNKSTAEKMTVQNMGINGHNDKSDAFRHCFFQAINTQSVGSTTTRIFANAHESATPANLELEKQMDTYNNEIGINYGEKYPNDDNYKLGLKINTAVFVGQLKYLSPLDVNSFIIPGVTQLKPTNQ